MPRRFPAFMSELPPAPEFNPVRDAIAASRDSHASSALQSFAGMPPSTGVFANPVRYHHTVTCNGEPVELSIRSFGLRGCLLEEDIVAGAADAIRTIFVGLFARFPTIKEAHALRRFLIDASDASENSVLPLLASLIVGLVISLFQALTQIQEQTLTFVPKIIATILVIMVTFAGMMEYLTDFTIRTFDLILKVPSMR